MTTNVKSISIGSDKTFHFYMFSDKTFSFPNRKRPLIHPYNCKLWPFYRASEDKKSLTPEPQPSVSRVPRGFSASPWKPRDRDPFSAGTDADSPIPPFRYKAPTLGKY